MNRTCHTARTDAFECTLLTYVSMCYSVALALTRDSVSATKLTREVLTWAWQLPADAKNPSNVKSILLTEMRERYLRTQRQPKHAVKTYPARA